MGPSSAALARLARSVSLLRAFHSLCLPLTCHVSLELSFGCVACKSKTLPPSPFHQTATRFYFPRFDLFKPELKCLFDPQTVIAISPEREKKRKKL
ncbi:hypothetical protein LZ31DRAFT_48190 [Colletotrichum somersetense]|nr:hypothetical protein LZ31DRAFT_48190 [Colletotrichum somersetense]